jgi:hypothetical protein
MDPAAQRQAQLDVYKTAFGVTDDGEWAVLEGAIGKVIDARTSIRSYVIPPPRGGRGGAAAAGGANANGAPPGGGRGGFGAPPSDEATALQAAIDNKAPADEIKAKLAALRAAYAAAQAKLTAAQEDLKKLLTSRQEAVAVLDGLLT